jgi:hypothetical protein
MTTEQILATMTNGQTAIENVQTQFFVVEKLQLPAPIDGYELPESFGLYNQTNGKWLGTLGNDMQPMQQQEFLDNIIQTVHECGADLDLSTLKFRRFCGDTRIEFSIQMNPMLFTNVKGLNEVIDVFVTFTTSYNGSKSNVIGVYTRRKVCSNGLIATKLEGTLKGRNTKGGKSKILSYCEEVADMIENLNVYTDKMVQLDKKVVTPIEIETFKLNLLGYNANTLATSEKPQHAKHKILAQIDEAFAIEFERTGETAFGLLQGVTYYTNHMANTSKKYSNDEYIRFRTGATTNAKAQKLVFEMV